MLKKTGHISAIISILLTGAWLLAAQSYTMVLKEINNKKAVNDWQGVIGVLDDYKNSVFSYPVFGWPRFENNSLRLKYNEGVALGQLGEIEAARVAFEQALNSTDIDIAAASRYNLALFAIGRNSLEEARSMLDEALSLAPDELDAKVNLELVIKRIDNRRQQETSREEKRKETVRPQHQPSDQWRMGVPGQDGETAPSTPGRNYL